MSIRSPYNPWKTAADFRAYVDTQEQAAMAIQDKAHWIRMSFINSAMSGHFFTDRAMEKLTGRFGVSRK